MKKTIIKLAVFIMVFLVSLVVISRIMNLGNENMTTEMASATLPVITMELNGISYNELHGYTAAMETAYQRETITELGENRELFFTIDNYGMPIMGIRIEVRSADGGRLIEDSQVENISASGGQIHADIALKDLLERDTEYALIIVLQTENGTPIYYYTRIIWSENTHAAQKLIFVQEFHETLFSRELALEQGITKYLESNATGDNTTFHKVNIHSSFFQITWGDLEVQQVSAPRVRVTELASQTGSIWVEFMVSTGSGDDTVYYMVEEFYRVRMVQGAERLYLLDYERTMTQIPQVNKNICANDKILLGIVDENQPFVESVDGNTVVFEVANRLFSYSVTNNKLAVLFGFYDEENTDARALYQQHRIKILDVDEGGNVYFAVYGYMNRGAHEGEAGIQIYFYDNALNMVEEEAFIPYRKSVTLLFAEMERLLYLNRDNKLYLTLDNVVYRIDLEEQSVEELITIMQDGVMQVSDDHNLLVWQEGEDVYHSDKLQVRNLSTDTQNEILAENGTYIMPLGFIGEDMIYGLAYQSDVTIDRVGRVLFPMCRIGICSAEGEVVKVFEQEQFFTVSCSVMGNQITLERIKKTEDGSFTDASPEYIMSNVMAASTRNKIAVAVIDVYEKYVQIQTRNTINEKNLQILTPSQAVFEGDRSLYIDGKNESPRYYVYGADGISGIFIDSAKAVSTAYELSGSVVDDSGERIWIRSNRVTRNQIMAIEAEEASEERSSLAVCLDTILKFEGVYRNSQSLLDAGRDVKEILEEGIADARALDLSGCNLDAILYYVNRDIPVLAVLENGEAVLIVGFNELNVVIMEPGSGRLYRKGMNDSTKWFEENGNCFITYMKDNS